MVDYGGFDKYWHQWIPVVLFLGIGLFSLHFITSYFESNTFFIPQILDLFIKYNII